MHTCINCGEEIDEALVFCDDECADQYMGVGEDEEQGDDGYDG